MKYIRVLTTDTLPYARFPECSNTMTANLNLPLPNPRQPSFNPIVLFSLSGSSALLDSTHNWGHSVLISVFALFHFTAYFSSYVVLGYGVSFSSLNHFLLCTFPTSCTHSPISRHLSCLLISGIENDAIKNKSTDISEVFISTFRTEVVRSCGCYNFSFRWIFKSFSITVPSFISVNSKQLFRIPTPLSTFLSSYFCNRQTNKVLDNLLLWFWLPFFWY